MSKTNNIVIDELNNIQINEVEDEGFIIDISKVGQSKTVTSWKVDLLFNSFQVVLTFYRMEDKSGARYKIEVIFSESVLTELDLNNILNFLIKEINTFN